MNIIVCLDDENGMLFNNRRQSSDRKLISRITELFNNKLFMNNYSAELFKESLACFTVSEDFLNLAKSGEFCFVEDLKFTEVSEKIEAIIVYRWNKVYPSDVEFPSYLLEDRRLAESQDFRGFAHEKIT